MKKGKITSVMIETIEKVIGTTIERKIEEKIGEVTPLKEKIDRGKGTRGTDLIAMREVELIRTTAIDAIESNRRTENTLIGIDQEAKIKSIILHLEGMETEVAHLLLRSNLKQVVDVIEIETIRVVNREEIKERLMVRGSDLPHHQRKKRINRLAWQQLQR